MENKYKNNVDKKVDLVVPCYKALPTLPRLLNSVAMQTLKDEIQVILVQDCDGEDYTDVIKMFEPMIDIELIKLEVNSGPGKARRIGMKYGKSPYITCMDSDDTFQNPFAVKELLTVIEQNKLDAVTSVFLEQTGDINFIEHSEDWVWMFGKIYRRTFLEEKNIEMNDSRANEDSGFNLIVSSIGKIGFLPDVTYIWHYKEDSITRKDGGIYRFTGIEGWLYNMEYAINNLVRLNLEEEKIREIVADNIILTFSWYLEFVKETDERISIKEYMKWVNKYYKNIYKKYTPSKEELSSAYLRRIENAKVLKEIPEYTFEQYLDMVGEGYNE